MRRTLRSLVLYGLAVTAFRSEAARPMSVEDLLTTIRVGDPRLSPDGKRVAFVRTTTDLSTGKRNADVWIVPADGSEPPRALTQSDKRDDTPRFSPDGKTLAFLSSRSGVPQVFLLDLSGGEARKLTDLSGGAQPPLVWSPDGKRLAFVSDVHPDCTDDACNKKKAEDAEKDPVKAHRLTRLLHRHWDEWREDVRHHVFVADAVTGAAKDVTPGDFDSPTVMYEDGAIAFSPDGAEIAFVSNRDGKDGEAWSTNMDVFVVPVSGGEARKVTQNPGADVTPVFSPDGQTLAVRSQRRAGFEADRWYVDLYERKTGARRTLFESPDLSVAEMAYAPDGKTIWLAIEKEGHENLYSIPAAGGTPAEVVRGGRVSSIVPGKDFVVYAASSFTAPAEIFRTSLDGKSVLSLTKENAAFAKDVPLTAPESRRVKSTDGVEIQYWLFTPPGFDAKKKFPTVFVIHGGPQSAFVDGWSARWNPELWAAQGWVVVCPNPRGSTGFGQKFVDQISGDWGGQVMKDLDAVFDDVARRSFYDPKRTAIAGASYGGYAVNWILGHTDRFAAAVTHDGVFNLESMVTVTEELWFPDWEFGGEPWTPKAKANFAKWSPHLFADRIKTPTLVITNELDYRVPVDQGLQLFTILRRRGVPCEAMVFPDEGHWVLKPLNSKRWHETVFGWLKKYLGGGV